jgi:polyisoprenyl-phosphate glycosyltransferase
MMNDDVKTVSATDQAGKPRLCVVVPCYNEEEVLPVTCSLFKDKVDELVAAGKVAADSSVLFVDDGSKDSTWDIIARLAAEDARFEGLKLSRNRGHQNALLAGLMEARRAYDVTISIDCDGQDDVNAMNGMIDAYLNDGCEIVYGVRSKRDTDTAFKRSTAEGFYRVLQALGVEVVFNHADYRLMSKRALDAFSEFKEVNLFLRGMVPLVGFKSTSVYYERHERIAGESHYPLSKMLGLAFDGVTSLSVKPIRMITTLGFVICLLSFIAVVWAIVMNAIGSTVSGWTSLLSVVCLLGGIQLMAIGVIGEYVGRIYLESKHRPRFIVDKITF